MKKAIVYVMVFLILLIRGACSYAQEVLTWHDCLKEAAKNHPDLISAEENIKQSQAEKQVSASPGYPQVDANLDASRARTKNIIAGKSSTKIENSFQYGVSASQILFNGSKTTNNVKSAQENIRAAQFNYKFVSTDVRLRLRTAFINLMKAQESLKILEEIFQIRRSNLELITLRYESGIEHKGALLTAQANLAQAQFEIAQNKRAFVVAQRELTKEMGRATFLPLFVKGLFEVNAQSFKEVDFVSLVDKHPSLRGAVAQKNAAFFSSKAAEADFFPELSVSAGANKNGGHWAPRDEQLDMGLFLSFPLFEGGLRKAQLTKAKSIYLQAQADERSTKDSLLLSLEEQWAALYDAVEAMDVEKKFLDAALERSRIAEAQYSLGLIEYDNWTIIEDDLVRAKTNLLNAQAKALAAEAQWIYSKGETIEYAE